jgi:hypothetical protein
MTRRDLADDARQSRPVRPPITAAEPVPAATTLEGTGIEPSPTSNRPLAQITSSTTVRLVSRERCPGLRRQFRVGAGNGLLPRERHWVERARWIRVAQLASSRQEPRVSPSWGIAARRSRRAASSPRSDAPTGLVLPAGNEVAAKNHRTGRPGREPPLRPAPRCRLSTLQPSIVPRGGRPAGVRGPALRCMDPSGSRHRPAQRLNLEAVAAPRQSASRHRTRQSASRHRIG